jgi:hypothetical protein
MDPIILDTDVASLRFKGELSGSMYARLAGRQPLITFVTLATFNVKYFKDFADCENLTIVTA